MLAQKTVVIISFTALFMCFSITNMNTDGDNAPKPPLYGIYKYENASNKRDNKLKEIVFDRKITILKWEDIYQYYTTTVDSISKTISFQSTKDSSDKIFLHYDLNEDLLTLSENDSSSMQFRKMDVSNFPLINRGFHWVVEYPENY